MQRVGVVGERSRASERRVRRPRHCALVRNGLDSVHPRAGGDCLRAMGFTYRLLLGKLRARNAAFEVLAVSSLVQSI